ncbi:hypothetical protein N8H41_08515 [Pseudomonas vlassakiae]|uniref:hypothetical protein n=1 Tax=Pseudomonas vlassakiae TaxID=485888 RepID=UPI0021CAAFF9|nr:hypothetical protein [Pseudomonas vlassakiae]MCU0124017.1 hypothetical protein [Pseudomonas vlassakiae]
MPIEMHRHGNKAFPVGFTEMHRHGNKAVPVGFTEMHRHANKAVPVGGTGVIGPKQMWERACPRCAARAALDLIGAAHLSANTWWP